MRIDLEVLSSISKRRERITSLEEIARKIRIDIIKMVYEAGQARKGHPGSALSITEIITVLYFDIMKIDPADPQWPDRDRFILSKGHASPALYAALANRGYFSKEHYASFRKVDGMLQGHPDMRRIPGVDMTTGSLGHGLSAGIGMAIASKIDGKDYHVFVIMGDGECQEGLVWEAAMLAPRYELNNLVAIIDLNGWQSCGSIMETLPIEPIINKWQAFGWNTLDVNGHNIVELLAALELSVQHSCRPSVIVAHTVKGKGVSFMENNNTWHQKAPTKYEYDIAIAELEAVNGKED
jgi:transketolase